MTRGSRPFLQTRPLAGDGSKDIERAFAERCAQLRFGQIPLSKDLAAFRLELSNEILCIVKSLPETAQTETLLMLTKHLMLSFEREMDFFKGFYPPAWSLLYWIPSSFATERGLPKKDIRKYQTLHAVAMLLHLLDDHLNDGDWPVSHLALLLRSQLWMAMKGVLIDLTAENMGDADIVRQHIETYYIGIVPCGPSDSLAAYCQQFKRQLGFGLLAPVLLTRRITGDIRMTAAVQSMFEAFGCAWRLLDDLQDITVDAAADNKSSVFHCLPDSMKEHWGCVQKDSENDRHFIALIDTILGEGILARIAGQICRELDRAADIADSVNLKGYARELAMLSSPLRPKRL